MIVFVVGTRPDLIKMAPLIWQVGGKVIHTGQHYSVELDERVSREMGISIDHRISMSADEQVATGVKQVVEGLSDWLMQQPVPGVVVVYGDTMSAMAAAIAAKACGWRIAHVEAGLRSFDMTMPEEVSRITIDALADRLYVPTQMQADFLAQEGITGERVQVLGNVIVDAIEYSQKRQKKDPEYLLSVIGRRPFVLCTLHRPENVDYDDVLRRILEGLVVMASSQGASDLLFPTHPRTRKRASKLFGQLRAEGMRVHMIDPVPHQEMIWAIKEASFVVTDSGGMQEESALLGARCVTVRKSTERQETVQSGHNVLLSPYTHDFYEMLLHTVLHVRRPKNGPITCYGKEPSRKISEDLLNWENWNG